MDNIIYKSSRLKLFWLFIKWFLSCSFLLRLIFFGWQYDEVSWNMIDVLRTFVTGLLFDIGSLSFISIPAAIYYSLFPNRWTGSLPDRVVIWIFTSLTVFILVLVFLAELTFWEEFRTRFNFIAVDYLVYTYEVISNIRQSYSLPLLLGVVFLFAAGTIFFFWYRNIFKITFSGRLTLTGRLLLLVTVLGIASLYALYLKNSQAEWSGNRYNSEISKSGIYSFFAAFRNNQMKYPDFYSRIDDQRAFDIIRQKLATRNVVFKDNAFSIHRLVKDSGAVQEQKLNVVFILMV